MNFAEGNDSWLSYRVTNFLNDAVELQSLLSEHGNGINAVVQPHTELMTHLNDFLINVRGRGVPEWQTVESARSAGSESRSNPLATGQAGTETRLVATDPQRRRPHFRYRMREIYIVATWTDDGLCARVAVRHVMDLNKDLQRPLHSMQKRMADRGFVVRTIGQEWEINHPNVNQSNWERELFKF